MTIRDVGGDEHYGTIAWGSMALSAANAFSAAQLPDIAEPTLIVDLKTKGKVEIQVDNILVWDIANWLLHTGNTPQLAGLEDGRLGNECGVTKDNTLGATDFPAADTIGDGTQPGGNGTIQTGNATGTARLIGETAPRFEMRAEFHQSVNEENAAGEINLPFSKNAPKIMPLYTPYNQDGVWVYNLLTAAHYWFWGQSSDYGTTVATYTFGGRVKKVSIDVDELLFDREVLFSLVDALAFQGN